MTLAAGFCTKVMVLFFVDSLFIVGQIVCCGFMFGPCFVMKYLVSYIVLLLSC